jgi:hypothetical protein
MPVAKHNRKERWLPIAGTIHEVSDQGRVRSPGKGIRKLTQLDKSGGYHACLSLDGKIHYVHLLVLTAFVGPRPPGLECRHLNGKSMAGEFEMGYTLRKSTRCRCTW